MSPPAPVWLDPDVAPPIDERDVAAFVAALRARQAGYVPEWDPTEGGAGLALAQVAARYLYAIATRLNRAPENGRLAFFDLLGIRPAPARAARAPVVFRLAANASDLRVPAGSRLAAPAPPGSTDQITFETERSTGLAAAQLRDVVSLWPGRDQYIDHRETFANSQPVQPFLKSALTNVRHELYLAHDHLLALAGKSRVDALFDLATPGSDRLDVRWEYWDGEVWRHFIGMRPECAGDELEALDGTFGFRRTGAFRLETECAETAKTTVDGIEAYWVRGVLTETLPANSQRIPPEIETITLSTRIDQPLKLSFETVPPREVGDDGKAVTQTRIVVRDDAGAPLRGVTVSLMDASGFIGEVRTDAAGAYDRAALAFTSAAVAIDRFRSKPQNAPSSPPTEIGFTLTVQGLELELAAVDEAAVDVSKPFFPFGPVPQPGAAVYFANDEVFAKPNAEVLLYLQPTQTLQDQAPTVIGNPTTSGTSTTPAALPPPNYLKHVVSWEYWNGRRWRTLFTHTGSTDPQFAAAEDFTGTGIVRLTVPADLEPTTIANQEKRWLRVRLLSGVYGGSQTVTIPTGTSSTTDHVTVQTFVPQPPALGVIRLGYFWIDGPYHPEHVLTFNDFTYKDQTELARWPGPTFQPFTPVSDATPALYLGFNGKLPVDDVGIFFDIKELPEESEGPDLVWEYYNGRAWKPVIVDDESRQMRVAGLARLIGPRDSVEVDRFGFGTPRHWLRARLAEDGPPGTPLLRGIYPNAVWAAHRQTVLDEPMGISTGRPNQVFPFNQIPVLPSEVATDPNQVVEVRELAGQRANVQWRELASELSGAEIVAQVERELWAEGPQTEVARGDLRLVRNRTKQVTEVWVRWQERDRFSTSGPRDRAYVVDRARGRLLFGDGAAGMAPPAGAPILARRYRTGGGRSGNLPAGAIDQFLGAIGGIEAVFNPLPAEGGADGETPEALARRGAGTIRHRGRAISLADYEAMAREASASVAVAHATATRDPSGRELPGWVTVTIIPQSGEPQPIPSFGLRQQVRDSIAARTGADLVADARIQIAAPRYLAVDVEATIGVRSGGGAGEVEAAARAALGRFLHPLQGGPGGRGWPPGRAVYLSDIAGIVERVAGVDAVRDLTIFVNGARQGERAVIPAGHTVIAGDIRLTLVEG